MKIIPVKVQAPLLENSDPWGVYIVPREQAIAVKNGRNFVNSLLFQHRIIQ